MEATLKSHWLAADDAASLLNISIKTLYSIVSRDRKLKRDGWFKKEGHTTLVDVLAYKKRNGHDETLTIKAQTLYFEVSEILDNDNAIAREVAEILNIEQRAAYMRLADFTFTTAKIAGEMIKAFEQILKKENKCLK